MARLEITIPNWLDKFCSWPLLQYRKHKFGLPFRKINLGDSLFTIVDPDVFYLLNKFNWCARKSHGNIYAVRFVNDTNKDSKISSMHRVIMNPPPGFLVDHKNNNTLDNTKANLRLATPLQNQFNKKKTSKKTSSKFIGVSFVKHYRKWDSRISRNHKRIFLGYFLSEIDAAKAYDAAAKKYHGEFARLNFPEKAPSS